MVSLIVLEDSPATGESVVTNISCLPAPNPSVHLQVSCLQVCRSESIKGGVYYTLCSNVGQKGYMMKESWVVFEGYQAGGSPHIDGGLLPILLNHKLVRPFG